MDQAELLHAEHFALHAAREVMKSPQARAAIAGAGVLAANTAIDAAAAATPVVLGVGVALAPYAAIALAGYGVYRFAKWVSE